MKRIVICAMLLITATAAFNQQANPSPGLAKQNYLQKSKHQKTAAWLLLGGGVILSTTSLVIVTTKATGDVINIYTGIFSGNPVPQNDYTAETILLTAGAAAFLSSIPLFIASGKNRRKGMSLSFKNERAPQLQKSSFVYKTIPSLTLKISL